MVAEVEVNQASGEITATRLVIASDCGPISNPDGLRNQLEGGALHGLSRTLLEEVKWDEQKVTSIDWSSYPPLFLGANVPKIETVLINRSDGITMGAGETAITVTAAAIANQAGRGGAAGVSSRAASIRPQSSSGATTGRK